MRCLTFEQILQLHALVLFRDDGMNGVRDAGRLEAAIATQHQEVFGEAVYPTIYQKAAAMMRGIIGDHPFVDGNKRTAMLVGMTLLEMNGYEIVAARGEVEDFAVDIATRHLGVEEIAEWLRRNSSAQK